MGSQISTEVGIAIAAGIFLGLALLAIAWAKIGIIAVALIIVACIALAIMYAAFVFDETSPSAGEDVDSEPKKLLRQDTDSGGLDDSVESVESKDSDDAEDLGDPDDQGEDFDADSTPNSEPDTESDSDSDSDPLRPKVFGATEDHHKVKLPNAELQKFSSPPNAAIIAYRKAFAPSSSRFGPSEIPRARVIDLFADSDVDSVDIINP